MPEAVQPDGEISPWLTVVTAVKDDPGGLRRLAESLREQDLAGVEWLIVDSSPTGLSDEQMPDFVRRVTTIVSTPPEGIYPAMNVGLAAATGTYVMFVNAGDMLASADTLSAIREAVAVASPTWLFGSVVFVTSTGQQRLERAWSYSQEKKHRFRRGRFPLHPGTIVRTATLRGLGYFDTDFTIAADYLMMLRLSLMTDPVRLDRPISVFRLDGVSTLRWRRSLRQAHAARCLAFGLEGYRAAWEFAAALPLYVRSAGARVIGRL